MWCPPVVLMQYEGGRPLYLGAALSYQTSLLLPTSLMLHQPYWLASCLLRTSQWPCPSPYKVCAPSVYGVLLGLLDSWRWDWYVSHGITTLHCIPWKSTDLIYIVVEAWTHTTPDHVSDDLNPKFHNCENLYELLPKHSWNTSAIA